MLGIIKNRWSDLTDIYRYDWWYLDVEVDQGQIQVQIIIQSCNTIVSAIWSDLDHFVTCKFRWYQLKFLVDPKLRSHGQRSKSNMQLCQKLVLSIYHEPIIGSW